MRPRERLGLRPLFEQIRPPTPFDFPFNRLDNIVCGWDSELDLTFRLRCKRFALLNFEDQSEDSFFRLLSAPAGTQRLMSAAIERSAAKDTATSQPQVDPPEERTFGMCRRRGVALCSYSCCPGSPIRLVLVVLSRSGAPVLHRDRFEKFLESVNPRLPLQGKVDWLSGDQDPSNRRSTRSILVDMTPDVTDATLGRRMFIQVGEDTLVRPVSDHRWLRDPRSLRDKVQVLFDATAGEDQVWHLEVRWNMCQGHRVEEIVKQCARRAKGAGLIFLQIPTGRWNGLQCLHVALDAVSVHSSNDVCWQTPAALLSTGAIGAGRPPACEGDPCSVHSALLCRRSLNQKRRALDARAWSRVCTGGLRSHRFEALFESPLCTDGRHSPLLQVDPQGGAFLWSINRLMPSQTARTYAEQILARFRTICEQLAQSDHEPKSINEEELSSINEEQVSSVDVNGEEHPRSINKEESLSRDPSNVDDLCQQSNGDS